MNRFLLACVFVFVTLAVAPAANAQTLTTLYNTITEPNDVQGVNSVPIGPSPLGTFRIATSFTPTTSGNASLVSIRARCVIPYPTGTTCQGIGEVSIQADQGGKPSGVSLGTMGFFLTDSTWSQPVMNDCGTLSPKIQLTAGTKYWAVMSAPDEIGWLNWKEASGPSVLESIDGSPWTAAPNQKTLALRIDAGFDACVPRAETNPKPGEELADMYVRTGKTSFNTMTLENTGVAPLTWTGVEFTGADASQFGLLNQEPGPLAQQFRFPRQIGVGGLTFLYVTCTGGPQERRYRTTMRVHTNDPTTPVMEYPVSCLVDNTPPTLSLQVGPPDGKNGWYVHPIPATLSATDPLPPSGEASLVAESTCERSEPDFSLDNQRWFAYGGFLGLTMQKEGEFLLNCSATDRAGNTGSAGYGVFKLDTRKPNAIPVFDPEPTEDGWNNTRTSLRFECEDPVRGSGVDEPASGGGTVSTETAGTDFTSADCNDIAGNVSTPVTATIRIDMTRPVIRSGQTPQANAAGWNRTDVTVTWDCEETGSVQSGIKTDTVADVAVTQETSGTTYTSGGTCADKAANQALTASRQIKLDKTDPTTSIGSGPPAATSAQTADITFSGTDSRSGVARFECSLDNGAWQTCTSTAHYADLADGPHDVRVRAYDVADNVDASPAQFAWTVDTVPPETTIGAKPDAATSSTAATITYSGNRGSGTAIAGYECRVDGGNWATCGSQTDLTALADGEHTFQVRAIDAAGNRDATPAEHTWTVDTIAPQTSIGSGPDAITSDTDASFTHSGDALGGTAVESYECRLDAGAWGACTSYTNLADGAHTFQVRAIDAAGNRDATPAEHTWTVDTIAPQTSISGGPDTATASRTATFTYAGDALTGSAIARYECRLDDADWGACAAYGDLADGEHEFRVRAVDSAGNRDATPAEHTWTVDTIAPQTSIDSGPDTVTASRTAAFTYGGDALGGTAITRYECRLDGAAWSPCAASYIDLAAGEHRLVVRATDAAGNTDADPATRTWTVDLAAPTTTFTNKPAARSRPNVMFEFSATDAGGSTVDGFQCSLDGAGYDTCVSGVIYRDLADGRHTFAVRATDGVGNVESPPVAYEWEVSSLFASDDETSTTEDTAVWIDVSQNDALVGATITADAHSQAGGTVTGSGEMLRYTPPANWSGTDHFGYTATRGADSVSAIVTVHVVAVNDPPAFRAGSGIVVDEDSGTYRAPWASAIAAGEPGQHVRFIVSTSNHALFSSLPAISPQGELAFTPAPNAYGTAVARIRLENDAGVARSGSVTITINPVDDAPTVTVARDVRCGRSNNGTFRLLVHDIDSDASKARVSGASSSDRVGLEFGGSGNERTVSITRKPGLRRATVTIRLTDGAHTFAIPVRLAVGTSGADRMRGTTAPDLLFGLGGNDRISARGGNDLICGGGGADRLDGGTGDDVVIGGRGDDRVAGGRGNDVVRGDTGADELIGGPGDDILRGGPRADLFAPAPGADTLVDFNPAQGDHR